MNHIFCTPKNVPSIPSRSWALLLVLFATVVAFQFGVPQEAFAAEFKIVAHSSLGIDTISTRDLSRIFLKRRSHWSTGQSAKPVDQEAGSATRTAFSKQVLGRTVKAIESHWQGQVFAGKASPPTILGSDKEVVAFVSQTPGAVGYVAASTNPGSAKVLKIVD